MGTKIGRNDPCPCGSGEKYKKCCGVSDELVPGMGSKPIPFPDRRLMERDLQGIQKLLDTQTFEAEEEADAFLKQITTTGRLSEWVTETPQDRARELVYEAQDSGTRRERIKLAKALGLWPDSADAYVLLAAEAKTLPQARDLYQQGVEAGVRALGAKVFMENADGFWGILETRPYMRALERLADTLADMGELGEAMGHYREVLRPNPNPFVPPYLLGKKRLPRNIPDHIGIGDKNEAVAYVAEVGSGWLAVPGAVEWVASQA